MLLFNRKMYSIKLSEIVENCIGDILKQHIERFFDEVGNEYFRRENGLSNIRRNVENV